MELTLPGQMGERLITIKEMTAIGWLEFERFQIELEKIARRDSLVVSIEEKLGRGYLVQWAPVDVPWPW